jgi:hypothetical protein
MSVYTEEYGPAVVHELTERAGPVEADNGGTLRGERSSSAREVPQRSPEYIPGRSVSVVCRLCHGDLDESLFCSLCGVVTIP